MEVERIPETLLETRNLEAGYGKLTILHGISMRVDRNEIVAIVGPNGSGKSTLVKAIYGLATVHEGEVHIFGKDATRMRADKLTKMGVSYVPQLANAFLNLNVRDNLELGALVNRHDSTGDALERIFKIFPILRERQSQKAGTLSGGERQMLAIGRALMVVPRILILDEPTATLSPKFASEVFQKIIEVRKGGMTILMVEQNARKALEMSDRGYVLVAGKKAYEGPSREILANQEFGKIFLGLASAEKEASGSVGEVKPTPIDEKTGKNEEPNSSL